MYKNIKSNISNGAHSPLAPTIRHLVFSGFLYFIPYPSYSAQEKRHKIDLRLENAPLLRNTKMFISMKTTLYNNSNHTIIKIIIYLHIY